ncbi:hypothetical protein K474DRAFT_88667 [Panus rudis PR-1116 ss-1]|nr:hypothetical protein K474DRAFT_88667 [Panus rudis PR-1116 ss-1]
MPQWAENMGRLPSIKCPIVDSSPNYPDPDEPRPVYLLVGGFHDKTLDESQRPWLLYWEVGNDDSERWYRVLTLLQSPHPELGYIFTYWGPLTIPSSQLAEEDDDLSIDVRVNEPNWSLEDRQRLEALAEMTPVQLPGGGYTEKDWIKSLLRNAVAAQLVTPLHRDWALHIARKQGQIAEDSEDAEADDAEDIHMEECYQTTENLSADELERRRRDYFKGMIMEPPYRDSDTESDSTDGSSSSDED